MGTRARRSSAAWLPALLAGAAACADPVRDAKIASLGPENPGVAAGPLHRAGQPCLACHDGKGSEAELSVAGTVFADGPDAAPVEGATVRLVDSARGAFVVTTNRAGNFFAYARESAPRFPVWASVQYGKKTIDMESPMNKDGDCGACHAGAKNPVSAGRVFVEVAP